MKTFRIYHFLLLTLGLLASDRAFAQDAAVIARVGDIEVRSEEVRAMFDQLDPREQAAISRDPALLNQSVRQLLVQRLVLKEALSKQWEKEPETAALIDRARGSIIVESYLQSQAKAEDSAPSEADLKAAYDANKAALVVPRQFKIAQIYVAVPKTAEPDATEKAKARIDAIRKSLRQPNSDFAAIARTQNDEKTSAKPDGEIGWVAENQLQPEIRAKVAVLAKSGVSDPIRLEDGWHIVKCLDVKESRTASFEEVRAGLAQQLRTEQARVARQAYLARLVKQTPLSVNELTLSKVLNKNAK